MAEQTKRKKPELLIPASCLEVLKVACSFGADAVYVGGEAFGLRAKAKNFDLQELEEGIRYAHARNIRVYITVNILAHNSDLEGARSYLKSLRALQPDAFIIADPGIFQIAKEEAPEIERHISTQANNTNFATFHFWHQLGASRVVTARELSLREIKDIRSRIAPDLEIETFVHGAMCMAYSGRCLLSNFFTGRDANHGACTHPCRWKYSVVEEKRPGEYMPVYEDESGTYIFNSKDLCMIEHIPDLVEAGIDSFKVEGRMKTALYVATAARAYRKAIDDYFESPEVYARHLEWYRKEVSSGTHRQFTTGFFYGKPSAEDHIYDSNTYITSYRYLGVSEGMDEKGLTLLHQKNKFSVGEKLEIMKPDGRNIETIVQAIFDENGNPMESAPHPQQELHVDFGIPTDENDIFRMEHHESENNS